MRAILTAGAAIALAASPASAQIQIQSQKPVKPKPPQSAPAPRGSQGDAGIFEPNATIHADLPPPAPSRIPRGAIGFTPDLKTWVTSVDGRIGRLTFSPDTRHVIRGHGLAGARIGWIMGQRENPKRGRGVSTRILSTGSLIRLDSKSDTEIRFTVLRVSAGELPWSSTNAYASNGLTVKLRMANGQTFDSKLGESKYQCLRGEPNCD